ncbi:MAG: hypothetical protein ACRDY5_02685, partial [Acidimicrobiales bacterium]
LGLTLLSHVIPTFFAITAAMVMALLRPSVRAVVRTATVGVLAGLVGAFWALPFLARLPYTNDMGWEKIVTYRENLLPYDGRWLVALAGGGAVVSLLRRCRIGTLLTLMALVAAFGFRFVPQGKIWNARLLPFWFLCLYLLAGLALAGLARAVALVARPGPARDSARHWATVVAPPVVLVATLTFVALPLQNLPSWVPLETDDTSFIPAWTAWNYSGYERKAAAGQYFDLVRTMEGVGRREGCGRALWEYEQELNELGTPLALMLLPYWTDGCIGSLEGLYYESSATTPFNFLAASELSKRPSRPQRNLPYRDLDLATGIPHLQVLGVRYYMAFSAEARAAAAVHPDLRRVATTGTFPVNYPEGVRDRTWEIYEVAGSSLVVPLEYQPVVAAGVGGGEKEWLGASVAWWQDASRADVPLAEDGPSSWARASATDPVPPRRAVPPVKVSGVRTGDGRISFDVDRPGSPVLVRASYFPNWKVSGADGPWRVSPNLMVVVPTADHVELRYGYRPVDLAGFGLTGLGLAGAVVLWRRDRRRQPDDDPGTAPVIEGAGPEPAGERGSEPEPEPIGVTARTHHWSDD